MNAWKKATVEKTINCHQRQNETFNPSSSQTTSRTTLQSIYFA